MKWPKKIHKINYERVIFVGAKVGGTIRIR